MRGPARLSWSVALFVLSAVVLLSPQDARSRETLSVPVDVNLLRTIARRLNPAIVTILTRAHVQGQSTESTEWFERFFGRPFQREPHIRREIGSGVLISADGDILTNDHVVADADLIEVRLMGTDTTTYRARLIGRDPISDSALIRLQKAPADLSFATLGDSDSLEPGDWVMAIGNPFRLSHSVTIGIVSYNGRRFEVDPGHWQKLIQTDASLNPGSSGGPLIDMRGEVVGINIAFLEDEIGSGSGIGFAVPINSIKALLPQLRAGQITRGTIGVTLRGGPITDDDAQALGVPSGSGVLVTSVERGSSADRSGLCAGDVIVEFAGTRVANSDDLIARIWESTPGTRARVTFIRDGRTRTMEVGMNEMPPAIPQRQEPRVEEPVDFGLDLGDVTTAAELRTQPPEDIQGSLVEGVEEDSAAARAGVEKGDVVQRVNRHTVHSAAEAIRELQRIESGRPAFLLIWRHGKTMLIEMLRD